MATFDFWPDLAQAWQATGQPVSESARPALAGGRWQVLKSESRARVVLLNADDCNPLALKIYRTPSRLAWRTFGIASRANREFTVMMNAHRLGLPIARPRYWLEQREKGCVRFNAIALDVVDGPDLETWLLDGQAGPEQRLHAAVTTGDLLGRFHRAGLFWGTVNPRNLLLPDGDIDAMTAIDMPYARLHDHDITGNMHATMDLVLSFFLSDGQQAFDENEKKALVLAYCAGDAELAQSLKGQLSLPTHREWKRKRLLRRLGNLFSKGASSAGRGGVYEGGSGTYRRLEGPAVYLEKL